MSIEGQFASEASEEGVAEPCVLAPTKAMEYTHVVPLFPTGELSGTGAKWMMGKPFSAGYTVAAAATLKAEKTGSTTVDLEAARAAARPANGGQNENQNQSGGGSQTGSETGGNSGNSGSGSGDME